MSWIKCLFDTIYSILFTKGKDVENYDAGTKINNTFFVPSQKKKMEKQANWNFRRRKRKRI